MLKISSHIVKCRLCRKSADENLLSARHHLQFRWIDIGDNEQVVWLVELIRRLAGQEGGDQGAITINVARVLSNAIKWRLSWRRKLICRPLACSSFRCLAEG